MAKYRFMTKNFATNDFDRFEAEVEIIRETEKSYRIKFLHDIWRYRKGSEIWVQKKNVIIPRQYDYSDAPWNKD